MQRLQYNAGPSKQTSDSTAAPVGPTYEEVGETVLAPGLGEKDFELQSKLAYGK